MKTDDFPLIYFKNLFSPNGMFLSRGRLKKRQIFVVIVFLVFLMLNPIVLNLNKLPDLPLSFILPNLTKQLETEDISVLNDVSIEELELTETRGRLNGSLFSFSPNKVSAENRIIFSKNHLTLKDSNSLTFDLFYTDEWNLSGIDTNEELITFFTKEWNRQNQSYKILGMFVLMFVIILVNTMVLVFGAAFFVWLTRKNHISSVKTFKESLGMTCYALFLPTIVAVASGMFYYDITVMLTIQTFGLALMILLIFSKTKFNDSYAKRNRKP